MRSNLPSGTVTFLFTDVEGSTKLLHELGAEGYADALAEHRRVIREACAAEAGVEVDTQGDAFFFAFPTAPGAVTAAAAFTHAHIVTPIRVSGGLTPSRPVAADFPRSAGEMERGRRGARVELPVPANRLARRQRLDLDPSLPEPLQRLGLGPHPAVRARADEQVPRQLLEHVFEVREDERVPLRTPPVRDDPIRQHDHVPRLLLAVDHDPTEAVSLDPRHRSLARERQVAQRRD